MVQSIDAGVNMRTRRALVPLILAMFAILLESSSEPAFAEELKGSTGGSLNALDSGYAITRWPWDGGDILPGETVQVRACTTAPPHPAATQVVFRWNRPDGTHYDVGPVALTLSVDTWDGKPIWDAYDSQELLVLGDWGVQALFLGPDGKLQGPNPYPIVKIRAISYHVVPEVPFGTAITILCMLGALGVVAIAKRKTAIPALPT